MDRHKNIILILILLTPLLISCIDDSNATSPIPSINYVVIASGENTVSGMQENRKIEVFTDQTSLNASLSLYVQFVTEYTVDFSTRRAVLLSMGGRPTGGYSIAAESIQDYGSYIKLYVVLKKPGNNCFTTQALTSPYQFIEIESVVELVVEESVVVVDC